MPTSGPPCAFCEQPPLGHAAKTTTMQLPIGVPQEQVVPFYTPLSRAEIGKRLMHIRDFRGMSQWKLATLAGYNCKEVVGRVESGHRELAYHEALAYSKVLCFSLDAFGSPAKDGQWDMMACLLTYPPNEEQTKPE